MNELYIELGCKNYRFKIGLRSIIYLQSLSKIDESDVFVAGLLTFNDITVREAKAIYRNWQNNINLQPLYEQVISSPFIDVRDLYSKAVGEMGISPAIFYQMSPEEVELAYQGYLRRQELSANLTKLAVLQAINNDRSDITISKTPEYTVGTQNDRDKTFSVLGIEK